MCTNGYLKLLAVIGLTLLFSFQNSYAENTTKKAEKNSISVVGTVNDKGTSARIKTAQKEYRIVMDEVGKKLAKDLNGKKVKVEGTLTGEKYFDMVSSLGSPTSGTMRSVEILELKVNSYKEIK